MEHSADGYSREFYEWVDRSSTAAARVVVPLVLQLVPVTSVIDVGCGTGGWLRAFADRGVSDLLGLDSQRVPLDLMELDREQFRAVDLTEPLTVERHFDLAVSLEVAEHLPEASAERLHRVPVLARAGRPLLGGDPRTGGRGPPQ